MQRFSSPSERTDIGKKFLSEDPETPGSLGIAISEAIEVAAKDEKTRYALGSVLNHVLMHQTIIGEEALKQWNGRRLSRCNCWVYWRWFKLCGLFTPFAEKICKTTNLRLLELLSHRLVHL